MEFFIYFSFPFFSSLYYFHSSLIWVVSFFIFAKRKKPQERRGSWRRRAWFLKVGTADTSHGAIASARDGRRERERENRRKTVSPVSTIWCAGSFLGGRVYVVVVRYHTTRSPSLLDHRERVKPRQMDQVQYNSSLIIASSQRWTVPTVQILVLAFWTSLGAEINPRRVVKKIGPNQRRKREFNNLNAMLEPLRGDQVPLSGT